MRLLFPFATLLLSVVSQVFEPADFSVTEALLDQGINVSALPELAGLTDRSSNLACNIAVSIFKQVAQS